MTRQSVTISFYALISLLLFCNCTNDNEEILKSSQIPVDSSKEVLNIDSNEVANQLVVDFMVKYDIPGLSLAISKTGKLVYAKGYGYANVEKKDTVTTSHVFRIASLSKPITSVLVMKLIEEGKISIDDKVFGENSILGFDYGTPPYRPWITDITVKNLLEHTAGGWGNDAEDPMFKKPAYGNDDLISYILDQVPLINKPGTNWEYSNFGYCILGRVIEKITGKEYPVYGKEFFSSFGVSMAGIAQNSGNRYNNEVKYYSQQDESPDDFNIERMDANGGWVMSALDYLKFLIRVDGFTAIDDILEESTVELMTTPSNQNPNYAKGWAVNNLDNWWHQGGLPGTASIFIRTGDEYCWVILLNSRMPTNDFSINLDRLGWDIIHKSAFEDSYDFLGK